jgi:mannose-1-phosphate guanylyltransferase
MPLQGRKVFYMTSNSLHPTRCAIILAGGDGKRLQPYIQQLLGTDLPKQYVNFMGTRSMLEHTYSRVQTMISAERIFTVVAQDHLRRHVVRKQLSQRPSRTIVIQPVNRETGPGLLLPLMHLYKRHPNSTVAVFPSDHFILQEERFMSYVEKAYEEVEKFPSKIVFLGIPPSGSESEYGYILPDYQALEMKSQARSVKAFLEKPGAELASKAVALGALWNTMVMVFRPEVLLHLVAMSSPVLYGDFQSIYKALDTPLESLFIEKIYKDMAPVNLSKDLIESMDVNARCQLSVIPMEGIFWSDWGSIDRILSVLGKFVVRESIIPAARSYGIPALSGVRMVSGF